MASSFVKTTIALAVLGGTASLASAQSSVQLYGIVDAAVRSTSNHGKTQMVGGGMSQSRWGINVKEDLGDGLSAIANLENRFLTDSGNVAAANYFQQSWVGLRSKSFGQLTLGRQYNILFDVVTSTYASFPYSPYMEVYKPEIGLAMGARNNNMLKYVAEFGSVRAALQYSFDEKSATDSKSAGGYLRYAANGLAVGGGYLYTKMPGGTEFDAYTLGASYRTGPWYFSAGYGMNKRKNELTPVSNALINAYWNGETNGGFLPGDAKKRQLLQLGAGYQITPQLNLGVHYYHAKQDGSASGAFNNKADFIVAVADYAFSKRTDAYFGVDYTRVKGGAGSYIEKVGSDLVRNRTGITVGLRHRF
ncbi:porin [Comamonas phosphati]|nr:porin [Comamonas phosphati]